MRTLLDDDQEPPNVFVEARDGNFIPVEELLEPFDSLVHLGSYANHVDLANAARDFGSDDPDLVLAVLGQIGTLRRGNVKIAQWDLRFIIGFVRANRPASAAQMCLAVQMAMLHLEILEAFKRLERAFSDDEYDLVSRVHVRLTRLYATLTVAFETLARRKVNDAPVLLPNGAESVRRVGARGVKPKPDLANEYEEPAGLKVVK